MRLILVVVLSCLGFGGLVGQEAMAFNPQLGVCSSVKNSKAIAAAGFDYIEESVSRFLVPEQPEEEFMKNLDLLRESAIPVLACNGFLPGKLKTTGPDTQHSEILKYTRIAFERAQQAGIKHIVFGSSGSRNYPEGFPKETALSQFAELLAKMGPIAEKHGIIVVIEPLQKSESNLINRVDEAVELSRMVKHPNILVLGDIFHMMREQETPESFIVAREKLHHVHLAELESRSAPGLSGDNFRPYLLALKEVGYAGGISIEGNWGDDFEKNLIIAHAYLRGQINTLH